MQPKQNLPIKHAERIRYLIDTDFVSPAILYKLDPVLEHICYKMPGFQTVYLEYVIVATGLYVGKTTTAAFMASSTGKTFGGGYINDKFGRSTKIWCPELTQREAMIVQSEIIGVDHASCLKKLGYEIDY